jgi:hypothetical protein
MELIDRDGTVIGGDGGLTVTPHPLLLTGQRHIPSDLIPGESLSSFLRRHEPTIDSGAWIVTVNGYEVPQKMWSRTRPKHGTLIECRSVVRKEVLRFAAIIALAFFTLGPGGAAIFGTTFAGYAAATAVFVAGSMIVNKVLGPKPIDPGQLRDRQASPTYALSGGRNRARAFEPIGLLFGEVRIAPDYASKPYTWFQGDDQYMYSVFHGGINCAQVNLITVGQTPLANYVDVSTRTAGFTGMLEQAFEGWGNVDSIAGGQLFGARTIDTITGDPPVSPEPGIWVTRTSSENTIALVVDVEGVAYYVGDDGTLMPDYTSYIVGEYRLVGSGTWLQFDDTLGSYQIVSASTKPIRRTYTKFVLSGQYEVRFRKDTQDVSGTREQNQFHWITLKSVQADTGSYGGMGRLGVKIKASGQLNGALDEVKWLATATPMDYWNGTSWVTANTRDNGLSNPGAQFLHFARGIYGAGKLLAGIGLSDSQIDIESLQGFMVHCAANGFTFDHYFDSSISRQDVLDAIAAVGMGSVSWQSGKLGVVWAAQNQPIEGVVNMATMKAKTFRVNYQTVETADGIEYSYFDRDRDFTWQPIRVIDPNVSVSLNPARITSIGVTTEAHAAKLARFHLAQSLFQRKDISFDTDLEHLTYKRMSVMTLTHDVTQWGYGGRLHSAINNAGILTLELDDVVPAGTSARYVGLRIPGEKGDRIFGVNAFTGESRTITLSEAWPVGVPVPGATSDNPAMDTLWVYDFKSTPGYKVRVASIQPQANMSGASVSVVPESAEFWDYVWNGTYTAPVNQSLLPTGLPVVSRLQVTEELQRQGNTFFVELTVTFDAVNSYNTSEVWGATTGNPLKRLGSTTGLRFEWRGTLNDVWTIEVRPFDTLGRPGTTASTSYTTVGLRARPADIANLSISGTVLSWTPVTVADLDGYIFRFHFGSNQDWGSAIPLHKGVITQTPFDIVTRPGGVVTIMAKALDTSGNESEQAAVIVANLGDPVIANVVETVDFKVGSFPGTLSGCTIVGGNLMADDLDSAYGTDDQSFYGPDNDPAYDESAYGQMVYTTGEVAINSALAGSVMTINHVAQGVDLFIEYRLTGPGSVYGADSNSAYGPDGESFYGEPGSWIPWPGQIVASNDVYQFRVTIGAGPVQGLVNELQLVIDAPDMVEYPEDVTISSAGTIVPYTKNFTVIKTVTATLQANGSGAVTVEVNKTTNLAPVLKAYNASHTAVSGAKVDIIVKGY